MQKNGFTAFCFSPIIRKNDKWATSWQNQQSGYVPSEDSDQPVCSMGS